MKIRKDEERLPITGSILLLALSIGFRYKLRVASKPQSTDTSFGWQTPPFGQIKKKKTMHISPYSEIEIWDLDELKTIIKYEPSKRNYQKIRKYLKSTKLKLLVYKTLWSLGYRR